MKPPEDYHWSSLGYHIQTGNKDDLLSPDFGLRDWEADDAQEIVHKYREFVYETGAVDARKGVSIDQRILDRERKRKYKVSRTERFLYRSRYFHPVKSYLRQGARRAHFTGQARLNAA